MGRIAQDAKALGLTVNAGMLQRWLNQDRDLRLSTVEAVCAVLGVRFVETAARPRPAARRPGRHQQAGS